MKQPLPTPAPTADEETPDLWDTVLPMWLDADIDNAPDWWILALLPDGD